MVRFDLIGKNFFEIYFFFFKGAYYYWITEDGKDYQTTILDIVDYSIKSGIPYRYETRVYYYKKR